MPFDGKDFDLEIDIYTLRRRKLCEALRKPMPEGFRFEWVEPNLAREDCGTVGCARGLAQIVFPELRARPLRDKSGNVVKWALHDDELAKFLGMSKGEADECFYQEPDCEGPAAAQAAWVADKIEEVCGK